MRILLLTILLFNSAFFVVAQPANPPTTVISVGVIAYGDYNKTYIQKEEEFNALAKRYNGSAKSANNRIGFKLHVGSYDDILAWYQNGLLNVAILSPGPVAELMSTGKNDEIRDLYIATAALKAAHPANSFATAERRSGKNHVTYHSVCIVNRESNIHTWDELRTQIEADQVEFLFVHPSSASGRILPEYVLRNVKGVDETHLNKGLTQAKWTYDHDATILALQEKPISGKTRVAFVWDQVGDDRKMRDTLRKIPIPELDQLSIPQEVVLISANFKENKQLVRDIFISDGPGQETGYVERAEWIEDYKQGIVQWLGALGLKPSALGDNYFNLQQIIEKVSSYEATHHRRARLALVLSGGGAKCVYQIGVIRAIENALNNLNEERKLQAAMSQSEPAPGSTIDSQSKPVIFRPLDVGLVVGTSGGAINALTVALGLTQTEEGQDALQNVWLSFRQDDFFRPWTPIPFTTGLIIGFGQVLLIIVGLRLFDDKKIEWRRTTRPVVLILLAIAGVLSFTPLKFWASMPLGIMIVFVGVQLFENQTDQWRSKAGIVLLGVAALELAILLSQVTLWMVLPIASFILLMCLAAVVIVLSVRVFSDDGENWRKYFWRFMPLIAVSLIAGISFWSDLIEGVRQVLQNHLVLHAWTAFMLNLPISLTCLFVIGVLMLLAELSERRGLPQFSTKRRGSRPLLLMATSNREFFANRKPLLRTLAVSLVVLLGVQLVSSLFFDPSLSRSVGMDHAFAQKLPLLLEKHPDSKGAVVLNGLTDQEKLSDLSSKIISNGWLKRDLIITTSLLSHQDEASDLYFYHQHKGTNAYQGVTPDKTFPPDLRFMSFDQPEYATRLLDVIIGSATIYPVFDPRRLMLGKRSIDLIDGGFAHNSPIEAAVAWGATHIILVEASPKPKPSPHRHLLSNSLDAFNYLFNKAQLTDARSRGKIEIFSIRPDPDGIATSPNLCTFDFDEFLMSNKMTEGLNDALKYDKPKFLRERGQPN